MVLDEMEVRNTAYILHEELHGWNVHVLFSNASFRVESSRELVTYQASYHYFIWWEGSDNVFMRYLDISKKKKLAKAEETLFMVTERWNGRCLVYLSVTVLTVKLSVWWMVWRTSSWPWEKAEYVGPNALLTLLTTGERPALLSGIRRKENDQSAASKEMAAATGGKRLRTERLGIYSCVRGMAASQ